MALARKPGPWLVLAGAGMCTGGRILNHLQNHLPDPTTLVLMVGYQSRGSVGRALADGAKEVRIAGQKVKLRKRFGLRSEMPAYREVIELLCHEHNRHAPPNAAQRRGPLVRSTAKS